MSSGPPHDSYPLVPSQTTRPGFSNLAERMPGIWRFPHLVRKIGHPGSTGSVGNMVDIRWSDAESPEALRRSRWPRRPWHRWRRVPRDPPARALPPDRSTPGVHGHERCAHRHRQFGLVPKIRVAKVDAPPLHPDAPVLLGTVGNDLKVDLDPFSADGSSDLGRGRLGRCRHDCSWGRSMYYGRRKA